MALKGNILFNGDFETGSVEGWIKSPFGLLCDYNFSADASAKYKGNFGGLLEANKDYAYAFIAYDKLCCFEEYEAYLLIGYGKIISGNILYPVLYGCDDKGNFIKSYALGFLQETGKWVKYQAILRGFREITHFKVGVYAYAHDNGDIFYVDEFKLMPLKSVKGHHLSVDCHHASVTSSFGKFINLACVGPCRIRSVVAVSNVSGTSPSLRVDLFPYIMESDFDYYTISHSEFTGEGLEQVVSDVANIKYLFVGYDVSGTDVSLDIHHYCLLYTSPSPRDRG